MLGFAQREGKGREWRTRCILAAGEGPGEEGGTARPAVAARRKAREQRGVIR